MDFSSIQARIGAGIVCLALAQLSCSAATQTPGPSATATITPAATAATSTAASACQNVYFPVKNGATWTYAGHFSKENYSRVFTVTNARLDSFEGKMKISDASGNILLDTTDSWKCTTGGLVELAGPLGATLQSAYGGASMKTLATTGTTIPPQIKPGDTWSQVSQLEFAAPDKTYQTTLTYNFTGFGSEQVTVPAGTFNAVKVQVRAATQAFISGQSVAVTVSGFEWFAPGVGHVKSSETVYAFGIPFASEEGELQSYKIP